MQNKKQIIGIVIFALVIVVLATANFSKQKSFEAKREKLLIRLYANIEEAEQMGRYKCCIKPACTMCYLGNWVWEDGSCYCDDEIKNENWERVCPQCIKGIEEGRCLSNTTCPVIL